MLIGYIVLIAVGSVENVIDKVARLHSGVRCRRISHRRLHQVLFIRIDRCHLLIPLKQLRHVFLRLEMAVEVEQFFPQFTYDLHLFEEDAIEAPRVHLYIAARLVDLVQESHLLLHYADDLVDVPAMRMNQLLFFFQDLLD